MEKSLRNILIISSAIVAFWILFFPSICAQAQSLVVDFETIPLFDEANFLPGESVTREVEVTNNSGESQSIATEAIDYPDPVPEDDLSRALSVVIREKGGSDLYGGTAGSKTLFNFYEDGEVYLSDIGDGSSKEYEYEISFPSDKGNEWQGKTTGFDILIGFQGTENGEGGDGEENGDGETEVGGIAGFFTLGLTIFNEENKKAETETATVSWFTNTPATSRVIYDTAAHPVFLGEPPNYGYSFSTPEQDTENKVTFHTVTITGLTPGVTYFWRAVSRGSPEVLGDELAFDTTGLPETPSTEESAEVVESPSFAASDAATAGEAEPPEEGTSEEPVAGEPEKKPPEEKVIEKNNGNTFKKNETTTEKVVIIEQVPEGNILTAFLADIGGIVGNIFGRWACLNCWVMLILISYSLMKFLESRKTDKEESRIWFFWICVLIILTICFCFKVFPCLNTWIFIILGIFTYLIRWFFSQDEGED
jgi:hypothetical protein